MQIFDKKTIEYLMKLFKGEIFSPDGNLDVEHEGSDPSHVRVKNDVGQLDLLVDNIGDRGLYDTTEYETGWLIKTDGLDTYMNKGDVKAANSIEAGVHISAVGDITAGRDASVGQDLTVTRDISAGRNITATGNVGADQDVAAGRNVSATGSVSAGLDVSATRNVSAGGNISATGNNSVISSAGSITAVGDISSTGGDISGNGVTATGNISTTNGNISSTNGNVSAGGTITATGNVTGAGFVVPNTTDASTKFLLADGSVDSYGRGWYMKRGAAYTANLQASNESCWLKVASATVTGASTQDTSITFFVGEYYNRNGCGILKVNGRRSQGASTINTTYTNALWICRDNLIVPSNYVVTGKVLSSTQSVFNVYCRLGGQYKVQRFSMLDEGGWGAKANLWTLYNSKPPVDNIYCFSDIPSDETAFESVDTSYAATAGSIDSSDISVTGSISAGTTITAGGNITLANGKSIGFKNTGGTVQNVLGFTSSNNLQIGGSSSGNGYHTYIDGNNIYIRYGTSHTMGIAIIASTGNVGVGKLSPAYKLDVDGVVSATSYNTASDERLKAIREEIKLNIEDIAAAPSILFNWKDKQDDSIHGGTIAQYWKDIASWAVNENSEGILGLDYSVLALSSAIQCAREVVDLRKEVADLKEQISELRKLVNG